MRELSAMELQISIIQRSAEHTSCLFPCPESPIGCSSMPKCAKSASRLVSCPVLSCRAYLTSQPDSAAFALILGHRIQLARDAGHRIKEVELCGQESPAHPLASTSSPAHQKTDV